MLCVIILDIISSHSFPKIMYTLPTMHFPKTSPFYKTFEKKILSVFWKVPYIHELSLGKRRAITSNLQEWEGS